MWTFGSQENGQIGTGTDGSYNSASSKVHSKFVNMFLDSYYYLDTYLWNLEVKMRYAGISEPFQLARCYERDAKTKKTKSMQVIWKWKAKQLTLIELNFEDAGHIYISDDENPGLCGREPPCCDGGWVGPGLHLGGWQLWKVSLVHCTLVEKENVFLIL